MDEHKEETKWGVYRAVNNRCAVDFEAMHLPVSVEKALVILERQGFQMFAVDLVEIARATMGKALYRRRARMSEAPEIFDCSSFTKWSYSWRGIWLPRRCVQQRECGIEVMPDEIISGDLIFTSGRFYLDDPRNGIAHVGLATGEGTVIHAVHGRCGVVEESVDAFMKEREFRGARRVIPQGRSVWTFLVPMGKEVEISDDIRWIILDSLSWT